MLALQKERDFYLANREQLDKEHGGKVIAIKDGKILGVYATKVEAIRETQKEHAPGSFLVQLCGPEGNIVQTFRSRVAFS